MRFGLRTKAAEVAPMLPDAVDTLGYGYCWRAIELHPGLAGPELVAHMRHRASISIMARQGGGVASEGAIAGDLSWLIDDPARTLSDRSEEHRVGNACCSTWRSCLSPVHQKKKTTLQ